MGLALLPSGSGAYFLGDTHVPNVCSASSNHGSHEPVRRLVVRQCSGSFRATICDAANCQYPWHYCRG